MSAPSTIEALNALSPSAFASKFWSPPPQFHTPTPNNPPTITLHTSSTLPRADLNAAFALLAHTSASTYTTSSKGWSPRSKRLEMSLPDLHYILIKNLSPIHPNTLDAFLSFMLTYEDGHAVIYCYEIHIQEYCRGMGLGKWLMGQMERVGREAGVEKSMLTVFRVNGGARKFYGGLGYGVDAFSPRERRLRGGVVKKPDYEILSKRLVGEGGDVVRDGNEEE